MRTKGRAMTYELEAITDGDMSACALVPMEAFFAPVIPDQVTGLLEEYEAISTQIVDLARALGKPARTAIGYFLGGYRASHRATNYQPPKVDEVFQVDPALAALDAAFWDRAMKVSTIHEWLPRARRDEWWASIRAHKTPRFTADNVRATFEDLFGRRGMFLAERIDGAFRALSRTHLTNAPMGFGKRMIVSGVFSAYGTLDSAVSGTIQDLRCVVAKFMGRDEPTYSATSTDLQALRKLDTGRWYMLDGGALRIRVYLKGTAHLEVHPDMAWRLNAILHTLHPQAIPASFRTAPPRGRAKVAAPMARPLPFAVLEILRNAHTSAHRHQITWGYDSRANKHAFEEAVAILTAIGGTPTVDGMAFDYAPGQAISEIVLSGCIPDKRSHQYYPTPASLARALIERADIQHGHVCLEPSAGIGNLAELMPREQVSCVEISALHCQILRGKGLQVEQGDFLEWAARTKQRFDRIVMNPPFAQGQAHAHVEAAAHLLRPGGRLAAIVPASMRGKVLAPGHQHEWSDTIAGAFPGTSVEVVMLTVSAMP